MGILILKTQIAAIEAYDKHQVQITNMFASINQRRTQLVNQRAAMVGNPAFDEDDLALVDSLIAYIDARYTHIE